ncbi:MAG: hypothetical protein U1C54_03850, partial [Xanthomonadaceae bacterium]|nr:hypothetical protein [Xanthomonadaceae bacterium]
MITGKANGPQRTQNAQRKSTSDVGWVERSETHHGQMLSMGFGRFATAFAARTTPSLRSVAALYPSYELFRQIFRRQAGSH